MKTTSAPNAINILRIGQASTIAVMVNTPSWEEFDGRNTSLFRFTRRTPNYDCLPSGHYDSPPSGHHIRSASLISPSPIALGTSPSVLIVPSTMSRTPAMFSATSYRARFVGNPVIQPHRRVIDIAVLTGLTVAGHGAALSATETNS